MFSFLEAFFAFFSHPKKAIICLLIAIPIAFLIHKYTPKKEVKKQTIDQKIKARILKFIIS